MTPPPTTMTLRATSPSAAGVGTSVLRHLRRRHADLVGGEHLRVLGPSRLRPRDLLAQVGADHRDAVEAEAIGHHARRTGADDQAVDRAFVDVALDFGDALGRAQRVAGDAAANAEFHLATLSRASTSTLSAMPQPLQR